MLPVIPYQMESVQYPQLLLTLSYKCCDGPGQQVEAAFQPRRPISFLLKVRWEIEKHKQLYKPLRSDIRL